jgi:hypothetical protein
LEKRMMERERVNRPSSEIYVYATNKNFLNIYDALRIDKIKVEVTGYDPETRRQTGHASAWLDRADARLLTHLVAHRLFASVTGGKWEKFGGSQREDGSIESRTLVVEWDEGDGGRFARNPYRLTISNGPGKKTSLGAVAPAGKATSLLSMRLTEPDMIKIMLAVGAYISAYETAHHHRLVAEKVRELDAKLAERAGQPSRGNAEAEPVAQARVVPFQQRGAQGEAGTRGNSSYERRSTYNAAGVDAPRTGMRTIESESGGLREGRASRTG